MQVDSLQPTFEDLELLAEVSQLLTLTEMDGVLQRVIGLAARAVGAEQISLFVHEHEQIDWAHVFTMRDLPGEEAVQVVTRVLDEGFAGWVFRSKRGDFIPDTREDSRWITFADDTVPVRSVLCVPFVVQDEVIAVVTLSHSELGHFNAYHLRLMTIIANQAATAVRNAQLFNRLRVQRRQLNAILQAMGDALIVVDEYGHIVLINEAARSLAIGDPPVIGRKLADFAAMDSMFKPLLPYLTPPTPERATSVHRLETRSERLQVDFQVTIAPWEDGLGGPLGTVIVLHDVTPLRDLSRFKDEMLRVATHDLRSPLALIAGYADMIRIDTLDPDSAVLDHVGIIKKSVERMGSLIDELLRVERIRNSPLELREQTDIQSLIRVAVVNMRPSAVAKRQQFETDIEMDDRPRIVADPVLLRQSMENLIANAIKYTQEGGQITVRARCEADRLYYEVEDTGIGIAPEHHARVFESFYRVESLSQQQKGNGLGLSLVRNVIMRHGGDVWLESELGKGSLFGFWLPLISDLAETQDTADDETLPTSEPPSPGAATLF